MTEKTDRMIAEAKLDRIDKLMEEVDVLNDEIGAKLNEVERLKEEAEELIE